jgi:DMSO/TMAO reductase YedYZ molybdopterin-dependent catalytic subunit
LDTHSLSRRDLLMQGGTARRSFPGWISPPPHPRPQVVSNLPQWEELDPWITPNAKFFRIAHYPGPIGPAIDAGQWKLEITGLVKRPLTFTLSQLLARPRREVIFTMECSGNHGLPRFISAIGTAKWAGTSLASLLQEAGVLDKGIEVVSFGSDEGEEEVRGIKMPQNFARSMSLRTRLTAIISFAMR